MPDFQTIVAAVDAAGPARDLLKFADVFATAVPGSTRFAVHAVEDITPELHPVLFPYACVGDDVEALRAELERHAFDRLCGQVSNAWKGLAARDVVRVSCGAPADTLLATANTLGPDILLMAASNAEVQQPGMLGSVTLRCLHRAVFPVLVVRQSSGTAPRRIAVGMDLTANSRNLLERALRMAHPFGAQVLPVSVLPSVDALDHAEVLPRGSSSIPGKVKKEVERRMQQLLSQVDLPFAVESQTGELLLPPVFAQGDPAEELIAHAAAADADIILVGRGKPGAPVARLGRVAEHVARHASCHVLVVPGTGSPEAG